MKHLIVISLMAISAIAQARETTTFDPYAGKYTVYASNGGYELMMQQGPAKSLELVKAAEGITVIVGFDSGRTLSIFLQEHSSQEFTNWFGSANGLPFFITYSPRQIHPSTHTYRLQYIDGKLNFVDSSDWDTVRYKTLQIEP